MLILDRIKKTINRMCYKKIKRMNKYLCEETCEKERKYIQGCLDTYQDILRFVSNMDIHEDEEEW